MPTRPPPEEPLTESTPPDWAQTPGPARIARSGAGWTVVAAVLGGRRVPVRRPASLRYENRQWMVATDGLPTIRRDSKSEALVEASRMQSVIHRLVDSSSPLWPERLRAYVAGAFAARGPRWPQAPAVSYDPGDERWVVDHYGRRFVMPVGSDDDELVFRDEDDDTAPVFRFPMPEML